MNTFGGFRFAAPTLQLQNIPDLVFVFHRLRIGPFEWPANDKSPALPEVADLLRAAVFFKPPDQFSL